TLRVFRARTARVAVVKMLAEASAAIEANDVARAVANLSDANVKSTLWPDLGARARILLHKATADVRTARNKLGMVQVTGNGDTVGDYWIDRTEVSNKDYAAFLEWLQSVSYDDSTVRHPDQPAAVDPRHMPRFWNVRGADDMPVVGVSYWDAVAYATWAGKQLPDADEWEWAARGGQAASRFPWGDEPQISNANAGSNGANGPVAVNADPNAATPTGILHMAGNVREWTDTATQHDGIPMQVVKGGSFRSPLSELLNATRVERRATHTDDRTGFRCVMRTPR
ncbi:MAG: formylglycine-generating enzyme family protein, partial [Planctomycetota bacterium]